MNLSEETKNFYFSFIDRTTDDEEKRMEWKNCLQHLQNRSVEFHAELAVQPNGEIKIICTKIVLGKQDFTKRLFTELGSYRFLNVTIDKHDWNTVRRLDLPIV